ncbi:glycosyltransferase family 2 protein [Cecembia calidifontis]|jgi:GT2 family glycosyltransferase|uniref:GT2 family glycosyltransferase n=1 Tax=Cecembia calidifontis TaxID=1187080 RepID=A0A4Q7P4M8_9BACT|nr:glycosyltransferase family 2 protein [Cecembia calidifontis]RZS94844.1 GT2 family glycosyltransferase [Cecembia calidifontis]
MNKVATIIVTYNGSKWIRRCLEQVLNGSVTPHVIIVDNNSSDDTIEIINPFLQKVELIRLQSNLGFGGANNIGIERALEQGYSHFFLLNQDAYVNKDCVSKLLETAISHPHYGIISPIQLDQEGIAMDPVFYSQVFKYYNPDKDRLIHEFEKINPADPIEVRFVGAAAWFISASVVKKAGFFHPVFFHYGEDNNFAARAQYFGYKIGIQVTTAVIHDRKPRGKQEFLPVKLRSFPLHQLLDIRKPFVIGWIVGLYQLIRISKKLKKTSGTQYKKQFLESRSWFFSKIKDAFKIRREMKKGLTEP